MVTPPQKNKNRAQTKNPPKNKNHLGLSTKENRQGGKGGYFSRLCWARVNTTQDGVGGTFHLCVGRPC